MSGATSQPNEDKDRISAGEYCTLKRADELGIINKQKFKESPFESASRFDSTLYKDAKTFNASIDGKDNRTKSLCKVTLTGDAYPHCADKYGPGYVKKGTSDKTQPYKCEVYDCPPGFERKGKYCSKEPVFEDAKVDKRSKCEERWYDWFLIPNYHLGNKFFQEKVGKCYAPCPVNHVPAFAEDPVDASRADFFSDDQNDKCVPRQLYFMGKYAEGTDYCPLAWIMRIYNMNQANARDLLYRRRKKIMDLYKDRTTDIFRKVAQQDGAEIGKEAAFLTSEIGNYMDNVEKPEEAMLQACGGLNTVERVGDAYRICKDLLENESLDISSDPSINAKQNAILRQACTAVFCDENNNALDVIGADPICFTNTKALSEEELAALEEQDVEAPMYEEEQSFFRRSFVIFVMVVFVPVFVLLIFMGWNRFVWPKIRKTTRRVLGVVTHRTYAAENYWDMVEEQIENARGAALKAAK